MSYRSPARSSDIDVLPPREEFQAPWPLPEGLTWVSCTSDGIALYYPSRAVSKRETAIASVVAGARNNPALPNDGKIERKNRLWYAFVADRQALVIDKHGRLTGLLSMQIITAEQEMALKLAIIAHWLVDP